jgi:2-haloalkanoic acid dehalogenase type II
MCLTSIVDLSDFRVLSFDCYGTLIDWETGILANIRPWLDVQGAQVDDVEILEAFGRVEAAEEASTPDALYPNILTRVHDRLGATWNLDPDPIAAARFGDSVGSWPPFSDSHDALTRLGRQYRLVILSNVDQKSFAASRNQLDITFDAVYTAETIGSYKPDPSNFDYMLEAERTAGYDQAAILHVGQSLFHDHVPAANAGIATCWIQRPSPAGKHGAAHPPAARPEVDFHFTTLAELAAASGN